MAPTDSRLRPDQRIMEEGDFERADKEKVRGYYAQLQRVGMSIPMCVCMYVHVRVCVCGGGLQCGWVCRGGGGGGVTVYVCGCVMYVRCM